MKLQTKTLKKILKKIKLGMKATKVEATQYIYFRDSYIYSYCDSYAMKMKLGDLNIPGNNACIHGGDFIKAVDKIKAKEIELKFNENELVLKAGKLKISFKVIEDEYFIELINETIKSHEKPPIEREDDKDDFLEVLVDGLLMCSNCVAKDMKHTTLCCIASYGDVLVANNNINVIEYRIDLPEEVEDFLIDGNSVKIIKTIDKKSLQGISVQSSWIHFFIDDPEFGDGILSVRRVKGDFLDCDDIFSMFDESEFYDFPVEAKTILDIILKISDTHAILKVTEKELSISSLTTQTKNVIFESFEIKYTGEPFEVKVDISILTDILKENIQFTFNNHICIDNDLYTYVAACKIIEED